MPIWGFIFILVAAIIFFVDAGLRRFRTLISLGLAILCVGLIFTYATSSNPIHF